MTVVSTQRHAEAASSATGQRILSLAVLTVLELSPPEMIDVAAQAGYSHVGLRTEPATPEEHHFPLIRDAALRRQTAERLKATGIRVLDIEILRLKPETKITDLEAHLALGAELGACEVLVAGNDPDEARLADNFAALCDLAASYRLYPHLEFMPWTDTKDLRQAMRIVAQANRDNGGILVDAFHFNRSGSHLEDLSMIPASRLRYAQLCDVAGPRPDNMEEILRQARHERRYPGDGDADLLGLLKALPANIPISLEIPTRQLLAQGVSALDRATAALHKTQAILAKLE